MYINFKLGVVKKALSQSDFQILKSVLSQEQLGHSVCFLHSKSEGKSDLKIFVMNQYNFFK